MGGITLKILNGLKIGKVNQMRSPPHPKIRNFDVEGLRDVESKKNILTKS